MNILKSILTIFILIVCTFQPAFCAQKKTSEVIHLNLKDEDGFVLEQPKSNLPKKEFEKEYSVTEDEGVAIDGNCQQMINMMNNIMAPMINMGKY